MSGKVLSSTCESCGGSFVPRNGPRKFCYGCLIEHKQDPKLYQRQYQALYKPSIPCARCGKVTKRHPGYRLCRTCGGDRQRSAQKPCRKCGLVFQPGNGRVLYCSASCSLGPCIECGGTLPPGRKHGRGGAFCSTECRQRRREVQKREQGRRRRVRRRGVAKGPYHDLEVFDRDRWRCRLCGEPVLPAERVPHPLAPTIDHIVPLAAGGPDTIGNVQCAHFRCNAAKGPRMVEPRT